MRNGRSTVKDFRLFDENARSWREFAKCRFAHFPSFFSVHVDTYAICTLCLQNGALYELMEPYMYFSIESLSGMQQPTYCKSLEGLFTVCFPHSTPSCHGYAYIGPNLFEYYLSETLCQVSNVLYLNLQLRTYHVRMFLNCWLLQSRRACYNLI